MLSTTDSQLPTKSRPVALRPCLSAKFAFIYLSRPLIIIIVTISDILNSLYRREHVFLAFF